VTSSARSTRQLLLIAVLFLTPFVAAVVMRFGGWEPPRTRNFGELLAPPLSMQGVTARRGDAGGWEWVNTERHWTLLAQLPASCLDACAEAASVLSTVHYSLGRHANKLHLFQLDARGPLAALALEGQLPEPLRQSPLRLPQVWLVDPHGYLVMRYAEGFDPNGLRRDLARLIK
jgi:hypothetical protein